MRKIGIFLVLTTLWTVAFAPKATPIQVFVIGDSTASPYSASSYPRMGWAQVLEDFFNPDSVVVIDKARSGRSSKSYYHESEGWPSVKSQLQSGDFLFIQFGHNDSKTDAERFTDPFTTYQEYLTRYIDEAHALGVTPVLMTSIHRNSWQSDTVNINDTHGDYLVAVRELADSLNVAMVDMANLTEGLFESLGYTFTSENVFLNLPDSLYSAYISGNEDNTHLQEYGAYELSKLVADELAAITDSSVQRLKSGLYDMIRVNLEASPAGSGYVQGPHFFPVDVERTIYARPATRSDYEFVGWTVNGSEVETKSRFSFSVSAGDSDTRLAEFALPTNGILDQLAELEVWVNENALRVESGIPMLELNLIDQAGRSYFQLDANGALSTETNISHLPAGVYYLQVRRTKDAGWEKILLD